MSLVSQHLQSKFVNEYCFRNSIDKNKKSNIKLLEEVLKDISYQLCIYIFVVLVYSWHIAVYDQSFYSLYQGTDQVHYSTSHVTSDPFAYLKSLSDVYILGSFSRFDYFFRSSMPDCC